MDIDVKELEKQKRLIGEQLKQAAEDKNKKYIEARLEAARKEYLGKAFDMTGTQQPHQSVSHNLVAVIDVNYDEQKQKVLLKTKRITIQSKPDIWRASGISLYEDWTDYIGCVTRTIPMEVFEGQWAFAKQLMKDFHALAENNVEILGANLKLIEGSFDNKEIDYPHLVLEDAERAVLSAARCPFRIGNIFLLTLNSLRWLTDIEATDYVRSVNTNFRWARDEMKRHADVFRDLQLRAGKTWETSHQQKKALTADQIKELNREVVMALTAKD